MGYMCAEESNGIERLLLLCCVPDYIAIREIARDVVVVVVAEIRLPSLCTRINVAMEMRNRNYQTKVGDFLQCSKWKACQEMELFFQLATDRIMANAK